MYLLLRPLLFLLPPEVAHRATFALLEVAKHVPGALRAVGGKPPSGRAAVDLLGMRFPNPVGLAAGMDKDAEHVDALGRIGFGHVEIGTVTPLAQPGNDRPRLFRLKRDRALINRMGFNNRGVHEAARRLVHRPPGVIVGGNIGKNKITANEDAVKDYLAGYDALVEVVDHFVVNVSSPNTPGLRALQERGPLLAILTALNARNARRAHPRPILLKIAPDLTDAQLDDVVTVVKESGIQGVVATNTTIARTGLSTPQAALDAIGPGGLSGVPLRVRSLEVLRYLRERLPRPFALISVGGIDSAEVAMERFIAGADLVQIYTGLVYEGPALVHRIEEAYARWKQ